MQGRATQLRDDWSLLADGTAQEAQRLRIAISSFAADRLRTERGRRSEIDCLHLEDSSIGSSSAVNSQNVRLRETRLEPSCVGLAS